MMATALGKNYHLFHAPSNTTLAQLNFTQTKALCRTLASDRVNQWFLFAEGFGDWKPLEDHIFDFIKQGPDSFNYKLPSVSKIADQYEEQHYQEIKGDRRESARFQRTLPVILDMQGQLRSTETVDISMMGIGLKDSFVVEDQPQYIVGLVKVGGKVVHMKFAPIYEKSEKHFNALECVACSDMDLWLAQQKEA